MRVFPLTLALVLPLVVCAGEPPAANIAATVADSSTAAEPAATAAGLGTPVSTERLAEQRGGEEIVNNTIHINGDVTNDTANNVVTGANNIQDGSFSNASGVMSVVQNTGANVLIQTATVVNVEFANPGP